MGITQKKACFSCSLSHYIKAIKSGSKFPDSPISFTVSFAILHGHRLIRNKIFLIPTCNIIFSTYSILKDFKLSEVKKYSKVLEGP